MEVGSRAQPETRQPWCQRPWLLKLQTRVAGAKGLPTVLSSASGDPDDGGNSFPPLTKPLRTMVFLLPGSSRPR